MMLDRKATPNIARKDRSFHVVRMLGAARCAAVLCLFVVGCAGPQATVTQFGTLDALMVGKYDGVVSCAEIGKHGDLGLGTFDKLDGEMVVADGVIYQITSDGTVQIPADTMPSPFATVTRFAAERTVVTMTPKTWPELEVLLDRVCPDADGIYSLRIHGEFPVMTLRSVPAQKKPYRGLPEVVKEQTVFHAGPIRGTLVGFRFPAFFNGVNAPGIHLHFISDDRKTGGHVLDVTVGADARIETARARRYELVFPDTDTGTGCGMHAGCPR